MEKRIQEHAICNAARLFLWNENLTKNQISPSEGLCICYIRTTFTSIQPRIFDHIYKKLTDWKRSTVIPFDLSKLLNKDASLGTLLVSSTLQFLPQTIKQLGDDISFSLFTRFQFTQAFLKPSPRPTYVIVLEISHIRCCDFRPPFNLPRPPNFEPPLAPFHRRFEKNWNDVAPCVSNVEFVNDPYNRYREDVVEYLRKLRDYTGEGGICPTKPPIAVDVARGFVEVEVCYRSWCPGSAYCIEELVDESCPVCCDEFRDENEVIATYCSHVFHIKCLLPWLSKKNTCPTCRAVYPLHYSPIFDRQLQ
ncbi:hypothetical protein KY290_035739 [Solanum tuberosum]|uniref:RING-type E3 ubiquitin transferase n=1 Tax=Solanum tuberosum TaxID=4113 RepID=A0ABQ7TQY0_SOLTU|nr:hypothetical protein KY290_035739 [Solanum tuberosum]